MTGNPRVLTGNPQVFYNKFLWTWILITIPKSTVLSKFIYQNHLGSLSSVTLSVTVTPHHNDDNDGCPSTTAMTQMTMQTATAVMMVVVVEGYDIVSGVATVPIFFFSLFT